MKPEMGRKIKPIKASSARREVLDILLGEAQPQSPEEAAAEAVDRIWDSVKARRAKEFKSKLVLDAQA